MSNRRNKEQLYASAAARKKEKEYWTRKMSGEWEKSLLPYDRHPAPGVKSIPGKIAFQFPPELSGRLEELCAHSDPALQIYLLSLVSLLIARYNQGGDIITGVPIYRQTGTDLINTCLPIRVTLEGKADFRDLLIGVREALLEGIDNQDYPIEVLAGDLGKPAFNETFFTLFDVSVVLENLQPSSYSEYLPHNISFVFVKEAGRIFGTVCYNTLLYKEASIRRTIGHFLAVAVKALTDTGSALMDMDLLSLRDKEQWAHFNATGAPFETGEDWLTAIRRQAAAQPGKIAIVREEEALSYGELEGRIGDLSALMLSEGVREGAIVGIFTEYSPAMIIQLLSVLKVRGVFLPLDINGTQAYFKEIILDTGLKWILQAGRRSPPPFLDPAIRFIAPGPINESRSESLPGSGRESLPGSRNTSGDHRDPDLWPPNQEEENDPACIVYGPRVRDALQGVVIGRGTLLRYCHYARRQYYGEEIRYAALFSPLSSTPAISALLSVLLSCKTLIIGSPIDPVNTVSKAIRENKADLIRISPSLLQRLKDLPEDEFPGRLQKIVVCAETGAPFAKVSAKAPPYPEIWQEFTLPETAGGYLYCKLNGKEGKPPPSVKPVDNAKVYLIDRFGSLVPDACRGRLAIGGTDLPIGYLNQPERTAAQLLTQVSSGERIYVSEYSARWIDGRPDMDSCDLKDELLKMQGYMIRPAEIERCLRQHPLVKDAIVTAPAASSGEESLCAFVLVENKDIWQQQQWIDWLQERLPSYMIPSCFVMLRQFPLADDGSVHRGKLRAPAAKTRRYEALANTLEERLAAIWEDILGEKKLALGRHSDFFEVGGQSLKAMQLVSRIFKTFHIELSLVDILRARTLANIAALMEGVDKAEFPAIGIAPKQRFYRTTYAQQRIFALQQIQPHLTAYNMTKVYSIDNRFDPEGMKESFRLLVERHEALRTSFKLIDKELFQEIHDKIYFPIQEIDMEEADENETESIIAGFVRPFDLERLPLLRAAFVKIGKHKRLFIVDLHHILSDGVSQEIMAHDFISLYRKETLPPLKLQYKDYAEWIQSPAQQKILAVHESFWLDRFKGKITPVNLPLDFERPQLRNFEGRTCLFEINSEITLQLKGMALEQGTTLSMVLLTFYFLLLYKISGQEDIVLGMPVANRHHPDLESLIGIFLNTIALRNQATHDKNFLSFLEEVNLHTMQSIEHQQYPMEALVRKVDYVRDKNRNPLFDVFFSFADGQPGPVKTDDKEMDIWPVDFDGRNAKFDLSFYCLSSDERIVCAFEYSTQLFLPEKIRNFSGYLQQLIGKVLADKTCPFSDLQLDVPLVRIMEHADAGEIEFNF